MTANVLKYTPSRTQAEEKDCAAHEEMVTNMELKSATVRLTMNT